MEQTRVFAASIMMSKEGKKSFPYNLRVDMRTIKERERYVKRILRTCAGV
jgi:hypothetical protein